MILDLKLGIYRFTILHIHLRFFELEPASSPSEGADIEDAEVMKEEEEKPLTHLELPIVDRRMKYLPAANRSRITPPPAPSMLRPPREYKYTKDVELDVAEVQFMTDFSDSEEHKK